MSFFKLSKSGFLPLVVLFIFSPMLIWGSPAKTPYRLDKSTAALVGDVNAELRVLNNGIYIRVQEVNSGSSAGLVGIIIDGATNSSRNKNALKTVAPLREMVKDIDFRAAMHAALRPMLKELTWPRVIDLQVKDVVAQPRKKDILMKANEGSFLYIFTIYQLTPKAEVLRMSTGFNLCLKGNPKSIVTAECLYSSERIGKFDINDEAIALWAEYDGAAYRQALSQGIEETVKMLNLALISASGKSVLGPDSKNKRIRIRTEYGEGSTGPKKGNTITGWIVGENDSRIIFQLQPDFGTFMSIPKSDIISQEDEK